MRALPPVLRLLLLCLPGLVHAQDTTAAKKAKRELQLYVGNQRLGTYEDMISVGLWYRTPLKGSRLLKYGIAYQRYEEHGTPLFGPAGPDSIRISRQFSHADMGLLGIGIEQERSITGQLAFYAGLEARAGYGSGCVDTISTVEPAPVGVVLQTSSPEPVGARIPMHAAIGQARGYLGVRSQIRRVSASLEIGGFFNGLYRAYPDRKVAITDLTLGTDFRAGLGYRF